MVFASAVLSLLAASSPPSSGARPPVLVDEASSSRWYLAQEEGEARPPPPGPRRFMARDAMKASLKRHPLAGQAAEEEAQSGGSEGKPGERPPPSPTPSPAPNPTPRPPLPVPPSPGQPPSLPQGAAAAEKPESEIDFAARAKKGKFSFEFSKAEIADVVKAISNLTQRNFIIPEKIKGQRITILSPTKITAAEAYQVFLVALEVNGITIVRSGKFYKLVESKDGIKSPIPTCIGDDDEECPKYADQMVTLLLHLKYVDSNVLNPVLKSLISKEGEITVFQPSNALIISEYAPNLARVRRIIDALDVPGFEDELQIVQIKYAVATEIADKLTQVFDVKAGGAAGAAKPGGPGPMRPPRPTGKAGEPPQPDMPGGAPPGSDETADVSISKIVPDDRTNQLIIKANRRSFDAIKRLIAKLDVPTGDGTGRVHVYYLENADAEELSSTLSSLAQGQPNKKAGRAGGAPGAPGGQPAAKGAESASLFEGEVKVTADKSTNSLLIMSSGRDFTALRKIIEKLDVPRRQVYVEAAILEVTVTDSDKFGLNWHTPMRFSENDLGSKLGGDGTLGFLQSAQSSNGTSPTLGALASPAALLGVAGGSVAGIIGKGISFKIGDENVSIPSFGVILKALQSSSTAQILSTPHVLTTDNEEASIEVGQKIPFRRGTSMPGLGGFPAVGGVGGAGGVGGNLGGFNAGAASQLLGNMFSSVDRIDVSLKLTLTPQINERDKVRLKIDQQVEDVVGKDESTDTPITANRSTKTTVVVDDQETVVLSGLMRDRVRDSESKIPILGDLPLIGWLFKQRSTDIEKVNLLLVLTPYIIHDRSDFQRIFERKMAEYDEFAAEFYGNRPEYRAYVDFNRKSGPLARLATALKREQSKVENGGSGDAGEILIQPDGVAADELAPATEAEPDSIVVPPEVTPAPAPVLPPTDIEPPPVQPEGAD
ncbi:MAG: type II secretion system secretin GspD [Deltaproteobacteria bacterium]|nr:type II secretion system secretin GspD [Deltaproteobacteria bacterium]